MEPLHIKLEYSDALNSKRLLLASELNILNISRHIQNYKILRNKELARKQELKSKLNALAKKLNSIKIGMPKVAMPEKSGQITIKEKESSRSLEQELQDIKSKLARLNY